MNFPPNLINSQPSVLINIVAGSVFKNRKEIDLNCKLHLERIDRLFLLPLKLFLYAKNQVEQTDLSLKIIYNSRHSEGNHHDELYKKIIEIFKNFNKY